MRLLKLRAFDHKRILFFLGSVEIRGPDTTVKIGAFAKILNIDKYAY